MGIKLQCTKWTSVSIAKYYIEIITACSNVPKMSLVYADYII